MTPRDTLAQPEGHIPDLIPDITTPDLGITVVGLDEENIGLNLRGVASIL
jgi:hypothetical protein